MRENICGKMRHIFSLPREVMLKILTFLPYSDLISVERTCPQWCDLSQDSKIRRKLATGIQSSWGDHNYWVYWGTAAEVRCAAALVTSGYLPLEVVTSFATRIQSSLRSCRSVADVRCAAALAATGHLT